MGAAAKRPASLSEIIASATRAERSATICVAGQLNARYAELEQQLAQMEVGSDSLAVPDGRRALAEEMERVAGRMRASEHTFTFRALPAKGWSDLVAAHPPRDGVAERWNAATLPFALVTLALCRVNGEEVEIGTSDLAPLWDDVLNEGQRDVLFNAAWDANTGSVSVPFSALASAVLRNTSTS